MNPTNAAKSEEWLRSEGGTIILNLTMMVEPYLLNLLNLSLKYMGTNCIILCTFFLESKGKFTRKRITLHRVWSPFRGRA